MHDARCPDYPLTVRERLCLAAALAVLMLVMLVASGCRTNNIRLTPHDRVLESYARLVLVKAVCDDGTGGAGSGVRIGGHAILTARHVVDCGPDHELVGAVIGLPGGAVYEAHLDADMPGADIARLDAEQMPVTDPVEVARPVIGERLCATFALPELGHRCGEVWPARESNITGDIKMDFVAEHGNSGSGVWDAEGRLVGILVALRYCAGTEGNEQVCTAGARSLWRRRWIAAP